MYAEVTCSTRHPVTSPQRFSLQKVIIPAIKVKFIVKDAEGSCTHDILPWKEQAMIGGVGKDWRKACGRSLGFIQ